MTIRKFEKDHLANIPPRLELVGADHIKIETGNNLIFWTLHGEKPCLVDLTDLALGQVNPKKTGQEERWVGGYSGRPLLINELIPAIKDKLTWAAQRTCDGFVSNLKSWWRLFDEMEIKDHGTGQRLALVCSVCDLTHLHHQMAVQRFSPVTFSAFRSVADATLRALGKAPLAWVGPGMQPSNRQLATPEQSRQLFLAIKRGWLDALDRWQLVDKLISGVKKPENEREISLLKNSRYFVETQEQLQLTGKYFVTVDDLLMRWDKEIKTSRMQMSRLGMLTQVMHEAFYPTATDIRMAFHLALIGGGWNVQTLLDLKVNVEGTLDDRTPFLKNHPQNSSRYILTGFKARGKSDHILHGDWKSDRSPGSIINTLVERTWPLRLELLNDLREAQLQLNRIIAQQADHSEIAKSIKNVIELKRKSTSVWIAIGKGTVEALSAETFDKTIKNATFLSKIIEQLNIKKSDTSQKIPRITASDFRDIFAEYIYRITGGSVLAVKQLLGQRSLSTAGKYLDNNIINKMVARKFVGYTNEMWSMLCETGRVDHTLLKQIVDHGKVSEIQILRLNEYRNLKKSRLKIGCRNPTSPPPRLDPSFIANGEKLCTMHRCMVCSENAVLAPESLNGLTMRLAELKYLQVRMPIENFNRGGDISFGTEAENIEAALFCFDSKKVKELLDMWQDNIARGTHKAPEFNGLSQQ